MCVYTLIASCVLPSYASSYTCTLTHILAGCETGVGRSTASSGTGRQESREAVAPPTRQKAPPIQSEALRQWAGRWRLEPHPPNASLVQRSHKILQTRDNIDFAMGSILSLIMFNLTLTEFRPLLQVNIFPTTTILAVQSKKFTKHLA